jgi:hypothetical protein
MNDVSVSKIPVLQEASGNLVIKWLACNNRCIRGIVESLLNVV